MGGSNKHFVKEYWKFFQGGGGNVYTSKKKRAAIIREAICFKTPVLLNRGFKNSQDTKNLIFLLK